MAALPAAEQDGAGIAGAGELAVGRRKQMLMRYGKIGRAKIAALARRARAGESPKSGQRAGGNAAGFRIGSVLWNEG